jgi:hypothetical protein
MKQGGGQDARIGATYPIPPSSWDSRKLFEHCWDSYPQVRKPMIPQYARYAAAIRRERITAVENLRTPARTPFLGARHRETAPARVARAKNTVARKKAADHAVRFPMSGIKSSLAALKMTTTAIKLSTAMSGHNRMPRSAGRRRFLLSRPGSRTVHTRGPERRRARTRK